MCPGRGWGLDSRGGFGVRKIGGGGLLRQWRRRSGERRGWRERERDGRPVRGRGVRLGLEGGGGDFTSVKG